MGFFSKLKQNMNHGGVKLDFEAPNTVSFNDKSFDVKVSISAATEQTINKITAELIRSPGVNNQNTPPREQVSAIEQKESFKLGAGESKEISIAIPVNASGMFDDKTDGAPKAIADALGKLGSVVQAMDQRQYDYYVVVTVDVDGISIDPSKQRSIQVLKPGEVGGSLKIGS